MPTLARYVRLGGGVPRVCRLGLATRGNTVLRPEDVRHAIDRGINYLNWSGHPDGLSLTVAGLGAHRSRVAVAAQLYVHSASAARRELDSALRALGTDYLDVVTFYWLERPSEWDRIRREGGALPELRRAQEEGLVRRIGVTSHRRPLAAEIAAAGEIDLLMLRYNAAHRGAERDVFPILSAGFPVVAYTCLRWGALIQPTPTDPPGTLIPTATDCYRFALSHRAVSVALMAPNGRHELDLNLSLLDDWRRLRQEESQALLAHGERVYRTAGAFP